MHQINGGPSPLELRAVH